MLRSWNRFYVPGNRCCVPGIDATVVLEIGLTDTLVVTLSGPTAKALAQINHGAGRIKLRDTVRCPEYILWYSILLVRLHNAYEISVEFHGSR